MSSMTSRDSAPSPLAPQKSFTVGDIDDDGQIEGTTVDDDYERCESSVRSALQPVEVVEGRDRRERTTHRAGQRAPAASPGATSRSPPAGAAMPRTLGAGRL